MIEIVSKVRGFSNVARIIQIYLQSLIVYKITAYVLAFLLLI